MRQDVARRVLSLLPEGHARPELELLYRMLRDYPSRGGKGVRSELLLLSAGAHGVAEGTPGWEAALWLAATLELFQNWVLIHDDIADDSEERRGRPALHRQYGVPLALNAGDALHAYMWEALTRAGRPAAYREVLDTIHRTAEGQHLDLAWVRADEWALTPADYLEMVRLKTAYYTVVGPLRLGSIAAGREPDPRFEEAGVALGAAFQIRDDVLNLTGDAHTYGKEIGGDLLEGKRTLMLLDWLGAAEPEQREAVLEFMRQPRADKDPVTASRILGWLNGSGATARAQAYAAQEAGRGLALLEASLAGLPGREGVARLLALAGSLSGRPA